MIKHSCWLKRGVHRTSIFINPVFTLFIRYYGRIEKGSREKLPTAHKAKAAAKPDKEHGREGIRRHVRLISGRLWVCRRIPPRKKKPLNLIRRVRCSHLRHTSALRSDLVVWTMGRAHVVAAAAFQKLTVGFLLLLLFMLAAADWPPTGVMTLSCNTRRILACISNGISPISSRNSVPRSASRISRHELNGRTNGYFGACGGGSFTFG
jgi:hypothetical protein